MINHSKEFVSENNRTYLLFKYLSDNIQDDLRIRNIIESYEMVKIIEMGAYYLPIKEGSRYHEYYNPGTPVDEIRYYFKQKEVTEEEWGKLFV
jgi:hypothetical protein